MKQTFIQLPYQLTLRRIYILPTRFGNLFIILLFAMLVGSVNYNNNLGFLLAFLLSSMGIVSIIHTYRNFSGIQIVSARAEPVFAGDEAVFELIISVDRHSRIAIKFGFDNGKNSHPVDLFTAKENRIKITADAGKRGVLRPGILNISTRYPFGLFQAWSRLLPDIECLVYPKPLQKHYPFATTDDESIGDNVGETVSGSDDFHGLTGYQPGDSLRHISWKAFSKGQGVMVKRFEGRAGAAALIDWAELKEPDPEIKLSVLCGMILQADMLKMTYGLKIYDNIIVPGHSGHHKHQCLKALALFDPEKRYDKNRR